MRKDVDAKRREFEGVVVEHHVRLRAFVRSLGVAPDWVDDLAQEAFLAAFKDWESFDQSRDFGRWIRAIALNIVRNEIRKDARRRRILHTELTDLLLRSEAESESSAESPALDAVRKCIGLLAPKAKEMVLGRYRDGQSAEQLSSLHGVSAASVRQMLFRSRTAIKRCVDQQVQGGLA